MSPVSAHSGIVAWLGDPFAGFQTLPAHELTYDHVKPRAAGGGTDWQNVVTACSKCNLRKGSRLLSQVPDMDLKAPPHEPTWSELQRKARAFPPKDIHESWVDFV